MRSTKALVLAAAVGAALGGARAAFAGGIDVINQGARGAGQSEAFAAQADDPSAIYYNPAGLTQLHGTQFSAGAYAIFPDFKFQGDNGAREEMNFPALLPHVYAVSDFGLDRFRFGIGLNNVFGLSEDWGNKGPLRTLVDKASLKVLSISPTIAYAVNEHLSFGAAINVYYGDLSLRHNVVLAAPPVPEGSFRVRGHDWSVGVTPGVMWKIDERNTVAAFYRSGFSMDLDGNAYITDPAIPKIGPSPSRVPIEFPQSAGLAYAVRPIQPWKLEADVVWTDWSVFNQVQLQSHDPHFNGQTIPEKWRSGYSFRFGTQYDLTRSWTLRGGYAYGQTAVPDSTFSPLVPDSNYHLFSVGLGYSTERWSLDAAYQFVYRERHHVHGSVNGALVEGMWDNTMNDFMLTFTYKL